MHCWQDTWVSLASPPTPGSINTWWKTMLHRAAKKLRLDNQRLRLSKEKIKNFASSSLSLNFVGRTFQIQLMGFPFSVGTVMANQILLPRPTPSTASNCTVNDCLEAKANASQFSLHFSTRTVTGKPPKSFYCHCTASVRCTQQHS